MTEQFEQAKREFVRNLSFEFDQKVGWVFSMDMYAKNLSDLNSLLEQHKEVMKEELRQKLLSMRSTKEAMDKLDAEDKLMQYGYHDCINEMLMWTKSLKP